MPASDGPTPDGVYSKSTPWVEQQKIQRTELAANDMLFPDGQASSPAAVHGIDIRKLWIGVGCFILPLRGGTKYLSRAARC